MEFDWDRIRSLRRSVNVFTLINLALAAFLVLTPRHFFRSASIPQNPRTEFYVNTESGLNVREAASNTSPIITKLTNKSTVHLIDLSELPSEYQWIKIEVEGQTGYVWSKFISKVQ